MNRDQEIDRLWANVNGLMSDIKRMEDEAQYLKSELPKKRIEVMREMEQLQTVCRLSAPATACAQPEVMQ